MGLLRLAGHRKAHRSPVRPRLEQERESIIDVWGWPKVRQASKPRTGRGLTATVAAILAQGKLRTTEGSIDHSQVSAK